MVGHYNVGQPARRRAAAILRAAAGVSARTATRNMAAYELHYWPSFTGRVEPILLLLSDAGASFTLQRAVESVADASHPDGEASASGGAAPAFAAPVLRIVDEDFTLAQTTAILEFLGRRHGYIPMSDTAQANCLQLALNAADMWEESYSARRSADEGAAFLAGRLPLWLSHLARFHAACSDGGTFFFGDAPTYADFQLLNVVHILQVSLGTGASSVPTVRCNTPALYAVHVSAELSPRRWQWMFAELPEPAPELEGWEAAMTSRPGVAAYLEHAEPVLYEQVAAGAKLPTPEEIAAWRAANAEGEGEGEKPKL